MAGSLGLLLPRRSTAVLRTGLIALVALVPSSSAIAQSERSNEDLDSPGLVIEAVAGWDGTVDRSTPIPVSFLINNYSERVIEGQLKLADPRNGREVTLGEVFVSPGATRRFTSIQDMQDWRQCFATLSDGAQVLWRRELSLSTGQDFAAHVNFALFIDDSGRELRLPGALSGTAVTAVPQVQVAGPQGRPIQCLTVKPWQLPNHPGPLVVAQAMIFPEDATDEALNRVQWRAVAKWICLGGTVFVHNESRETIERLTDSVPLDEEAAAQSGEFMVRRVGLGSIYEYPRRLFSSEGSATRQQIADRIARLTKNDITTLINTANLRRRQGGRADWNQILVVTFFGFYTFLSGVVALLLFRQSRRRIAAYTVVVVAVASVLSALLGGLLRFSQGDLRWMTVTQAGTGGLVQVGNIDVQSAGGRNRQVAVNGEHSDLQVIGHARRYYSRFSQRNSHNPFTWQRNLANSETDTYQVEVPMTPWGRRRLQATAFTRESRRLDFKLDFKPPTSAGGSTATAAGAPGMSAGDFSLTLVNHLPFDITDCSLVIGVTQKSLPTAMSAQAASGQAAPFQVSRSQGVSRQAVTPTVNGPIDVYHRHQLGTLAAGATFQQAYKGQFQAQPNYRSMSRSWPGALIVLPRISHLGTASAWIIGRIENPPIISIDEQRSDFVVQEQFHLFVQEILPEDMPDTSFFLKSGNGPATEAAELGTP